LAVKQSGGGGERSLPKKADQRVELRPLFIEG
jgi:hypothetical protein